MNLASRFKRFSCQSLAWSREKSRGFLSPQCTATAVLTEKQKTLAMLCFKKFCGAVHILRISACKSVIIFKCSRAAGALIMGSTRSRRACNSQLLRMPQAHRRSCDKNQPISYGLSVTKHQKLSRTADHSCTWWFLYLISNNISRSKTNARARNHLSFAETS